MSEENKVSIDEQKKTLLCHMGHRETQQWWRNDYVSFF